MSILITILLAIHVIVSLLIIFVTLMQRPKNEGLGAAFGGGMTENLFGAQTTNVLATFTRWLGGIFFALTLVLSMLYARQSTAKSGIQQKLLSAPIPVASPAAKASPAAEKAGAASKAEATARVSVAQATPAASAAPSVAPATPAPSVAPAAPAATPAS